MLANLIWGAGAYRFIVQDQLGNEVYDADTVAPALSTDVLLKANNLSDVVSASSSRSNLGLGTAAVVNTGTTGAAIPLLNGANTFSGAGLMQGLTTLTGGAQITPESPPAVNEVGYLGVPQGILTGNYVLAIGDAGKEKFFGASVSCTIPPNASVAFPIGTIIDTAWDATFTGTLVPGSGVTLRWLVGNVTGTRTITGPGTITIKQEKVNEWWIRGSSGVS